MELQNIDTLVSWLEKEKWNLNTAKDYIQKIFSVFQWLDAKKFEADIQPIIEAIKGKLAINWTSNLNIDNPNLIEDALKIAYVYQVLKLKLETRKKLKKEVILKTSSSLLTIAKSESLFWESQREKFKSFILDPKNHEPVPPEIHDPIVEKNAAFEKVKTYVTSAIIWLSTSDKKEIPWALREKFFTALTQNYIDFCNKRKIRIENILQTSPAALVTWYYIEQKGGNWIYNTYIPSQRWLEEIIHNTFLSLNVSAEEKKLILDIKIRIIWDNQNTTTGINTYLLRVFWEQIKAAQAPENSESKAFIEFFRNIKWKNSIDISLLPNDFKEVCYSFIKWVIFWWKEEITIYDKNANVTKKIIFEKSKEDILKNLIVFIAYTLDIESNFSNKVAPLSSSATWYVQFPNGNFGWVVNMWMLDLNWELPPGRRTKLSQQSLWTAIIRTSSLIRALKIEWPYQEKMQKVEHLLRINNDTFWLKASDLEWDMQILLLLWNIFNMTREDFIINNWVKKRGVINRNGTQVNVNAYLSQTLLNGSEFFLSRTYWWLHHTSPDEATRSVRTNRLLSYRQLLKSIESWYQNTIVLKTVSQAVKERIKTFISWPKLDIQSQGIESFLKELLILIGYNEVFPVEEGSNQVPKKKSIKDLLNEFQLTESIQWANGNYWPKTKERIESVLLFFLQGWEGEDMENKIMELIDKHFPTQKVEKIEQTPLPRGVEDISKLKLRKIPKNIDISSYKITPTEIQQILAEYTKNAELLRELAKYLNIPEKVLVQVIKNAEKQNQLYGMNYSSRVILYYLQAFKNKTLPSTVKDFKTAKDLVSTWKLTYIEDQTEFWRIDTRLWKREKDIENKKLLQTLTPKSKEVLTEIWKRFQEKTKEFWLPEDMKVRMIVNSMLRPQSYNAGIVWASYFSAHMIGFWFDLSIFEFDIIRNNTYTTVTSKAIDASNIENQLNNVLTWQFTNILLQVLIDMDREKKIILTREGSHPHITVIQ